MSGKYAEPLKAKDISDDATLWKGHVIDPNDSWQDYVNWKKMRSEGFQAVVVDGVAFRFGKYGLDGEIDIASVKVEVGD